MFLLFHISCIYFGFTKSTNTTASCMCYFTFKSYRKCSSDGLMNIFFRWVIVFVLLCFFNISFFSSTIFVGTFVAVESNWLEKNFQNTISPLCSCADFIESTVSFFLHCTHFANQRLTLSIEGDIAEILLSVFLRTIS